MQAGLPGKKPTAAPCSDRSRRRRGNIEKTITGTGEAKGERVREAADLPSAGAGCKSFDAPLNKRVARRGDADDVHERRGHVGGAVRPGGDILRACREGPERRCHAGRPLHRGGGAHGHRPCGVTLQVCGNRPGDPWPKGQEVGRAAWAADESRVYGRTIVERQRSRQPTSASGSKFTVTVAVPNDGSIRLGMSAHTVGHGGARRPTCSRCR